MAFGITAGALRIKVLRFDPIAHSQNFFGGLGGNRDARETKEDSNEGEPFHFGYSCSLGYKSGSVSWPELNHEIVNCRRCPRLRSHCEKVAQVKRRQYRDETYWGRPVTGFGDPQARLWVVGLAPAAHGANRTGRMFTGDSSGDWLYRELHAQGWASQPSATGAKDGLRLKGVFISSAGRCAPPDNKPTPSELDRCFRFLQAEFQLLKKRKVILALGKIGFDAVLRLLEAEKIIASRRGLTFAHGASYDRGGLRLMASYHPSRQNTQTGRLTQGMWSEVFTAAKKSCRE